MHISESLGDNCEYGFWQRDHGYEPSSLFRWAISPPESVLAFLQSPVELFQKESLMPHTARLVKDELSGFSFHSNLVLKSKKEGVKLRSGNSFERQYEQEKSKIDYLQQKFFSQLKSKPKLFVIKRKKGFDASLVKELLGCLRSYCDKHVLLVVTPSDEVKDSRCQKISDGLYYGQIPFFANHAKAAQYHPTGWSTLMESMSKEPELKAMVTKSGSN